MQLVVDHKLDPAASLPSAFKDLDVMKIVYDKINALRIDDNRVRALAEYSECHLSPFLCRGRTYVSVKFKLARPELGPNWCCYLYDDFTLADYCSYSIDWSKDDGEPLVKIADN